MPTTTATPPRLSIVIPAPGDEATLEETLVSVLENRPEDSEIVLGFGYHDPWSVGEEVRFIQAPIGSNRVACINLGLAASTGRIVHVLAAGWRATPFWTDVAVEHFNNEQVAAVVPLEADVSCCDHGVILHGYRVSTKKIIHRHPALHLRRAFGAAK